MLVLGILRKRFLQLKNHIWITYALIIGINDTIVDVVEYNMLMLLLTLLCDASVMVLTLLTLQMSTTLHIRMWCSTQEHTKILQTFEMTHMLKKLNNSWLFRCYTLKLITYHHYLWILKICNETLLIYQHLLLWKNSVQINVSMDLPQILQLHMWTLVTYSHIVDC
jgi:hypothetical protein